jgi:hypothetical protein
LWQALQVVHIVGIPVNSLTASTAIVSAGTLDGSTIAMSFKNAVQAQYIADKWGRISQSAFDKLRQNKRDALVAQLLNDPKLNLQDTNQLFEYFLVDSGMEPVVQTSRLCLALYSVQTFIQRCLLNLENANKNTNLNVAPSAIDADQWGWMKRYPICQANREIFIYPDKWIPARISWLTVSLTVC